MKQKSLHCETHPCLGPCVDAAEQTGPAFLGGEEGAGPEEALLRMSWKQTRAQPSLSVPAEGAW